MTKIEWCDETWNPVTGCTKVSAGCKNCYAEGVADRFWGDRKFTYVQTHADRLDQPLRWRRPRRVFVNSMSDLFHDAVPSNFIGRVFGVMAMAKQHTFQVLTKRPERMRDLLADGVVGPLKGEAEQYSWEIACKAGYGLRASSWRLKWPLPNVWLGVSVEDQRAADERIPLLLQTPAAVRFLSCEPLLGPVDLHQIANHDGLHASALQEQHDDCFYQFDNRIDWVIAGGESGPGARPCDVAWIRSLVQQCKAAAVPCFVKQLGSVVSWNGIQGGYGNGPSNVWPRETGSLPAPSMPGGFRKWLVSKKGGDPDEWPEDLRVREFPALEARS